MPRDERRLRALLIFNAVISAGFVVYYLARGAFGAAEASLVINSVGKDALLVALSLVAAAHLRRHGWLTLLVVLCYGCLIAAQLVMLLAEGFQWLLAGWMAADLVLIAALTLLYHRMLVARERLAYLDPYAFATLRALAEALVDGGALSSDQVARNVDGYLARLDSRGKGRVRLALLALTLFPLAFASPPLAAMSPERRLAFVRRRFDAVADSGGPLRGPVQAMIRVASQFAYLGYYGDPATHAEVGYEPFSERAAPPARVRVDLRLEHGATDADVLIVGSGAGGALLAHRLAEAGREVLLVERGPYVDPGDVGEAEIEQYLQLYNEGALGVATDFRLQVLQGMCVGGSTVVNNAVCFDTPAAVLAAWEAVGVDAARLRASLARVRLDAGVAPVPDAVATPAAGRFMAWVRELGLPGRAGPVEANMRECVGCGYCNIGCAFGRKLSMLAHVLPDAQRRFGDRLRVLPSFEVAGIEHDGRGRAVAVHGERGRIAARTIVVAAGALGSSLLLQRSRIGGARVGADLHFNINSPLTAEFDEPVDAFAGLQMSHAYDPGDGSFLLETWFNPPGTQSLAMPGWFERHRANMLRYRNMACAGVLVGTSAPGSVRATRGGFKLDFRPAGADLRRVVDGLQQLGAIYLAAGARRVMPATYAWHAFGRAEELAALDGYVDDNGDLLLTSAHPQGGNAIGTVLDERLRVRGFENLHVCDASVFPSSVGVNPQLTVLALADYAAPLVADSDPR